MGIGLTLALGWIKVDLKLDRNWNWLRIGFEIGLGIGLKMD